MASNRKRIKHLEADIVIKSENLCDLLDKSKKILLKNGVKTRSQRGLAWGLNRVLLVWEHPYLTGERYAFWPEKADGWYQKNFVHKRTENLPERLAKKGNLLFPYTYAHRSRFRDNGWGYGLAVVNAAKKLGIKTDKALSNYKDFETWLSKMAEMLHLQTILSVLSWWNRDFFEKSLKGYFDIEKLVKMIRIDVLARITNEIKSSPTTRRAITPSFMYPSIDYLLDPMMGVPPYQNFQLLPSSGNSRLSSLHWHRSLDASGGAQLDFNHDFDWLMSACQKTDRDMGSIGIFTGNLHLYAASDSAARRSVAANDDISAWLKRVTDGYKSGEGMPKELLEKESYKKNAKRIYSQLTRK